MKAWEKNDNRTPTKAHNKPDKQMYPVIRKVEKVTRKNTEADRVYRGQPNPSSRCTPGIALFYLRLPSEEKAFWRSLVFTVD